MTSDRDQPVTSKAPAEHDAAPVAPPCAMVIFGASGDLTKRLLVPALYNLAKAKRLSSAFQLVGVARALENVEAWRKQLTEMMNEFAAQGAGKSQVEHLDETAWRWLTDRMSYLKGTWTIPEPSDG